MNPLSNSPLKNNATLLLIDESTGISVVRDLNLTDLSSYLEKLGDVSQTLEIKLSKESPNSLLICGGQDKLYIVGTDQPHGWQNASPKKIETTEYVRLVTGGQETDYPRNICFTCEETLQIAQDFLKGTLSDSCYWDNPPI